METLDTLFYTMVSNLRNFVELKVRHESISVTTKKVRVLQRLPYNNSGGLQSVLIVYTLTTGIFLIVCLHLLLKHFTTNIEIDDEFHEKTFGKPATIRKDKRATISQHLWRIIYGMARELPTRYNRHPKVVS